METKENGSLLILRGGWLGNMKPCTNCGKCGKYVLGEECNDIEPLLPTGMEEILPERKIEDDNSTVLPLIPNTDY